MQTKIKEHGVAVISSLLQMQHRQNWFSSSRSKYKIDVATAEGAVIKYNLLGNKTTYHIHQGLLITPVEREGNPDHCV